MNTRQTAVLSMQRQIFLGRGEPSGLAEPVAPASSRNKPVGHSYDGRGRRIERRMYTWNPTGGAGGTGAWNTTPTAHSRYVWFGWLNLLELDALASNAYLRKQTWGLDLAGQNGSSNSLDGAGGIGGLLAVRDTVTTGNSTDDKNYIYFYDGNGNVREVIDSSTNAVAAHYEYDPYGAVVATTGSYAATNTWRFSTKQFDPETGLGYWGYRWYDPRMGRWISRDPLGERGGLGLFIFSQNSPSGMIDALGLEGFWSDFRRYWSNVGRSIASSVTSANTNLLSSTICACTADAQQRQAAMEKITREAEEAVYLGLIMNGMARQADDPVLRGSGEDYANELPAMQMQGFTNAAQGFANFGGESINSGIDLINVQNYVVLYNPDAASYDAESFAPIVQVPNFSKNRFYSTDESTYNASVRSGELSAATLGFAFSCGSINGAGGAVPPEMARHEAQIDRIIAALQRRYPGIQVDRNVIVYGTNGEVRTQFDLVIRGIAALEVKTGRSGRNIVSQALVQGGSTDLPLLGFAPDFSNGQIRHLNVEKKLSFTNDFDLLIDLLAPPKASGVGNGN